MSAKDHIKELMASFAGSSEIANLQELCRLYPGRVIFSTSFGLEDQVITHLIAIHSLPIKIFTLDTGRMFAETYSTWSSTVEKYGVNITAYYPDEEELQKFVSSKGPNSFYESVENRKQCCHIRKVEPLKRALNGSSIWITGIRAEQSNNRHEMTALEWDEANLVIKYHPLLNWSWAGVKEFASQHDIPINPLHDKGFLSIGCAPCTRAIKPGEDFRAGRWWWEDDSRKECGLHVHIPAEENIKE